MLGSADEVLHSFSNKKVQALITKGEWDKLKNNLDPPDDRIDKHLLLLGHDRLVHASHNMISFESRQYPSHGRLEAFKESCVDVVGVEVGQFNRAIFHLKFLSQRVSETCECKLACRVV